MKIIVLLVALVPCVLSTPWFDLNQAASIEMSIKEDTDVNMDHLFGQFATLHKKQYRDDHEKNVRKAIFAVNVEKIREHNKLYDAGIKSYSLGINQFTDMTNDEYRRMNGLKMSKRNVTESGCGSYLPPSYLSLPEEVDWRKKGYVTPVKNQGQCGSCWSFSTTGSLEGQHFKKTGKLVSLSEQQLVDCSGSFGNQGCNGGLMDNAFEYIKSTKGLDGEDFYPYKATEGQCKYDPSKEKAKVTGCQDIQSGSESDLQSAVASVGPISIAIDASHSSFQMYKDGVYDEPECSSEQLDHGVLVVGYGTQNGQDYWLVKNSWGEQWGQEGYIMMSRNKDDQCGVASQASFPNV